MRYEWSEIEPRMLGNWQAAIMSIVNVPRTAFSPKHGPCPSCGGSDRYRFDDNFETKGDGGAICNQCGNGSGITWLMKLSGMTFPESMEALAGFLNMHPREKLEAIRKQMPKVNHSSDYLTPEEVKSIMDKTQVKTVNTWTKINGIGCDINVINGKSGELVVVPMIMVDTKIPCNVAFISADGDVAYRAGYSPDSYIKGKLTRGAVTPIGEDNGKFIYLVSDYADAWRCHYFTGAHVWCCWSPENMWEVARAINDDVRPRLRCIINYNFDELCSAENADLPVMLPDDSGTIRMAKRIRRKPYVATELLDKMGLRK
ncbi:primase helicase [Citrobacter phage vB_CfrS_K1M]